jgi:hypothetical protein
MIGTHCSNTLLNGVHLLSRDDIQSLPTTAVCSEVSSASIHSELPESEVTNSDPFHIDRTFSNGTKSVIHSRIPDEPLNTLCPTFTIGAGTRVSYARRNARDADACDPPEPLRLWMAVRVVAQLRGVKKKLPMPIDPAPI